MGTNVNVDLKAQLRTPREIRLAGDRPLQSARDKRRIRAEGSILGALMAMPSAIGWRASVKR